MHSLERIQAFTPRTTAFSFSISVHGDLYLGQQVALYPTQFAMKVKQGKVFLWFTLALNY